MKLILSLCLFFCTSTFAQLGGKNSFTFLHFPVNAKTSAVGGMNASIIDNDPTMMINNPALLNAEMHNRGAVNFSPFVANINYTTAAYAFNHARFGGTSGISVQYMYYGIAREMDAGGNDLGANIGANEFAITAGHSHTLGNFTLGANVKLAGSQLARSTALGLLTDIGGIFKHPKHQFTVALLIKNLGFPIKSYGSAFTISMPLDIQIGATYKPEHMPFRFSVLMHHLNRWDIAYDNPNNISGYDISGKPIIDRVTTIDHIAQHFVFGGEFLLSKGFNIRVGYNQMMRKNLKNNGEGGLSGFSLGFMIKVKMFEIAYSHAFYHAVGGLNTFSLIVQMDNFYKKAGKPMEPIEISD